MIAASTFLSRMNEGRTTWLTQIELLEACKEFLVLNGYSIEFDKTFGEGSPRFESPLVGFRDIAGSSELLATYIHPQIEKYEIGLFGSVESALFSVLDNADDAAVMLVTDSLSYFRILHNHELNLAVENVMGAGLYLLFLNNRSAHALFDDFRGLTAPIPIEA